MTDHEGKILRSLRGTRASSAKGIAGHMARYFGEDHPLANEDRVELVLRSLHKAGRVSTRRLTPDGRKIYTAYS